MTRLPLLDTNVILRHVLHDVPDQSPRATALVRRVEQGQERVRIADTVVFEAVFTLERFYKVPRAEIRDTLLPIIQIPGIVLTGKRSYHRVFDLYVAMPALSFADCYHAVLAREAGNGEIITFDRGFDRAPGVTRIEP